MATKYELEDIANHAMLYNKWAYPTPKPLDTPMAEHYNRGAPSILTREGQHRRVVIYTGPGWEPWTKETVDAGMAGSETWAAYLAREFVKKGYRTTLYGDLPADKKNDAVYDEVEGYGRVVYRDHTKMTGDLQYDTVHCFISSRTVEPLRQKIHSLVNLVMIHDVFLNHDRNYDIMPWAVHGYSYLSDWHKDFLLQHHTTMPPEKMFLSANGLDMGPYTDVDTYEKKNMTVWGSSPDRGLYQFMKQIFPRIRKEVPDFEVVVAYGWDNWEKAARARNDIKSMELMKEIKASMKQPGVRYVGRISKKELAHYQKQSKVWLFSSWFSETFCISASSAGAAKCAIVCTDLAGLKTTVGDSGVMLAPDNLNRDDLYPESYVSKFVEESVKLLKDETLRKSWADKAYDKMRSYDWGTVADVWIKRFERK